MFCNYIYVLGHEHECRIQLEENAEHEFQIFQSGSSVATSLVAGEAVPKHVGILEIKQEKHRFYPVPLYTTRPFEAADIRLEDELVGSILVAVIRTINALLTPFASAYFT
jgi:double-strand break repair protein MRE11